MKRKLDYYGPEFLEVCSERYDVVVVTKIASIRIAYSNSTHNSRMTHILNDSEFSYAIRNVFISVWRVGSIFLFHFAQK